MHLTASRKYTFGGGTFSILTAGDSRFWLMEREWNHNIPNISCVPRGTYDLVPHESSKYPATWALEGLLVSHFPTTKKPRYACVIHACVFPTDLQGCLAPAESITAYGSTVGSVTATNALLAMLERDKAHTILLA